MRDLPLNALRAFATVYARGGVRPAARELGIAHSSASRHLANLERFLGIAVIEPTRDGRRLIFTPQGHALGQATLASLSDLAHAVETIREARSANSVVIGAAASFAVRWLLPRIPAFEQEFPQIEVSVVVERGTESVGAGAIDLAVSIGRGGGSDARGEILMDDGLFPVMSPALWRRSGRPSTAAGLVGLRLLHDRDPGASWEAWQRAFGPSDLDCSKGPRFTSSDLVLRAAAVGQGVALARQRLAADDLKSGVLCRPIPALCVSVPRAYWLFFPKQSVPRPATQTFAAWLRRQGAAL